jgi:hypothetical protein
MSGIVGEATVQRGRRPEVLRLALLVGELKLAIVHARSVRQEAVSDKVMREPSWPPSSSS